MFMNDKLDPDIATKLRDFLNRNPASMGEKTKGLRDGLVEQGCPLGMSFGGMVMDIEQKLYDSAVELIGQKYPVGWGGAAAMYTQGGRILTSVAPEASLMRPMYVLRLEQSWRPINLMIQ